MSKEPVHTTPAWVKWLGGIFIAIVLAGVVLMVAGGGNHGPGRHFQAEQPAS